MLTESFIASLLTSSPNASPASSSLKDVGICVYEVQPTPGLRTTLKKSSTGRNCLAWNESHVFAAQTGKAVVHVYSREKNNHEATVPFPERIRSLAWAGSQNGAGVLVLGTEGGRLIIWETCTGRQTSTSASHLSPVTSLVIDPTNNFILSGSDDANVHVWSLPNLISFSRPAATGQTQSQSNSPLRTFSHHRAAIADIAIGHSNSRSNIAISVSRDNTAIVWEYRTGQLLRTFLLPASPTSLAVDPADRAFYVAYDDGSVQLVDFFKISSTQNVLYDTNHQSTPSQLSANERWLPPSSDLGPIECLTLSYDGMTLLSGHRSGAVVCWDIAKGRYASNITTYPSPVTNLQMLPLSGLPQQKSEIMVVHTIVKPRYDHALSNASQLGDTIPASYAIQAHLTPAPHSHLDSASEDTTALSEFSTALSHSSFPASLLSEGLAELRALESDSHSPRLHTPNGHTEDPRLNDLEQEVSSLKNKIAVQESARQGGNQEMAKLREYIARLEDYNSELQDKEQKTQQTRIEKQTRKEERATKRREAWFEAEKRGQNGDAVVRKMEIDDESSDVDVMSSDDE
ncbi:hypothetical protein AJ80_05610 [Polytolypa hystricis UAMH7299]|uniref:Pre-rRNA-processing protein IPI3 n=1 Tax=Polytolypa hystricis (strain UAMH7299) TaxID=1447883 RepID=A0A2B7Y3J0_POLH7|nr:hypothetical protein AJ80_05610 [Polytolypa hystricis UAMH7299]